MEFAFAEVYITELLHNPLYHSSQNWKALDLKIKHSLVKITVNNIQS